MSGQLDGVSRRGLFKRGLFGAALLSIGGGATLALRTGRDDLESPEELEALTPSSYPVLFSVAEAVKYGRQMDGPVLLLDLADCIGGGAAGDSVATIAGLLDAGQAHTATIRSRPRYRHVTCAWC